MYYDPYLAHYGVKGMKWGVRKQRNAVSSSGKGKKTKSTADKKKEARKKLGSDLIKTAKTSGKKMVTSLGRVVIADAVAKHTNSPYLKGKAMLERDWAGMQYRKARSDTFDSVNMAEFNYRNRIKRAR